MTPEQMRIVKLEAALANFINAADPFVRATRLQEPLALLDDIPVRNFIPGAWPIMKDARALVEANEKAREALETE